MEFCTQVGSAVEGGAAFRSGVKAQCSDTRLRQQSNVATHRSALPKAFCLISAVACELSLVGRNADDQFTRLGLARHNGSLARFGRLQGGFAHVQPQSGLAAGGIRPVTRRALIRQDRPNVAIEIDRLGGSNGRGQNECCPRIARMF